MTTLRFHGSAAVLLLPLALFVAVTARLFISEAAFDLTGLAAAGVLTLFSGSLLAKAPSEYWKAAVRGASSELTGTVVLILIASGIFSAMMKASGVADGLVFLGGMLHLTGHAFTVFVLLASSLMAAATGSSIGTLLAAMPIFFPAGVALGADPAMLAGAVLSGAIFGDNLAPVSDVTVISSVTQRFRDGTPADIAGVVRTRLPYAMTALAVSMPVYAFMGASRPVSEAALSGDASALLMLVPVAVLIAVAVRTRDVLMAISADGHGHGASHRPPQLRHNLRGRRRQALGLSHLGHQQRLAHHPAVRHALRLHGHRTRGGRARHDGEGP